MTKYERNLLWKKANRKKVSDDQRAYRNGHGREVYKRNKANRRARTLEWYKQLKSTLKCQQCGESHFACLAFHHRDPSQKDNNITSMVNRSTSIARIEAEIAKCDVLCHNCHAKVHWAWDQQSAE